ncbi:MAG TPA: phenylalanine--tRNA ligase subunit alpha, partial [Candidatus Kapabacteria bacterium]|nr:phenylalanine--tRNA ligase subunit alpha [Candidatus Kapabacteria bacterium]
MSLREQIVTLREEIQSSLNGIASADALEAFRLKHLVRKGTLQGLVEQLRTVPADEKPLVGKELNALKALAEGEYERLQKSFETKAAEKMIDVTLPGRDSEIGHVHLITQTLEELKRIFAALGFTVEEGPEIEDDYHNFEALNFAPDHPARDMQDTFHIDDPAGKYILRTHTSPVQIRVMERQKPPIRAIVPGRVYRNEAISARSHSIFHMMEGLVVDEGVTFAELQGTLLSFAKQFYGEKSAVRFRPSYFPFTEPSAEMDVTCYLCDGKGCRVCKGTGWLEILGCGMVHPNVL